ncbi:MAG TPA: DUF4394 domain-containing protein, partial [Acidimicrobiia bacterium]|nr:DUF4394 domain-containing protein [Acidimicrobiia bacterium]
MGSFRPPTQEVLPVLHRLFPLAAAALLAAGLTSGAPARAAEADKANLIGLTVDDKLVTFASAAPATLSTPKAITGLQSGENLLGLDVRPSTGQVFALGSSSRLYTVDPESGAATAVGDTAFTPALTGTTFGFDFNPVVDRIRVVSDTGQNLRLHPDTGAAAATDTNLAYAADDPKASIPPAVTGSAYTDSFQGATDTTLFGIDTTADALVTQAPPNAGVLRTVGALGVDATDVNGFDVDVTPGEQNVTGNAGLAALTVGTSTGLYTVNLTTGAATLVGPIGDGTAPLAGLAAAAPVGYWLVGSDGAVYNFGDADALGSTKGTTLSKPVVGMTGTPSGEGYWLVASDGGIFNYGDAPFYGSTGAIALNQPIVGMAPYGDSAGYWMVAADGGIFSFARPGTDDRFYGSMGAVTLNQPMVGMATYPNGKGYWLVARDGGIFSFFAPGETDRFYGSTGAIKLNKPIVGMTPYPDGDGYWFVASDGGIFSYAAAGMVDRIFGSTGDKPLSSPIVGMTSTPSGKGYWLVASDGGIFAFGDAAFFGSTGNVQLNKPIVDLAPSPDGDGYWLVASDG